MEIQFGPRRQGLGYISRQLQVARIQLQFEIFARVIRQPEAVFYYDGIHFVYLELKNQIASFQA